MRYEGSPPPPPLILVVPGFEGTLDDLLILVRSGLVSVSSLPLAQIASAVLNWVCELESQWKIDSADVVNVTAALIRMKSRSLLPAPPLESPAAAADIVEAAGIFEDLDVLRNALQHLREMWKPNHTFNLESFMSAQDPLEMEQARQDTVFDLIRTLEDALRLTRESPPPLCYVQEPYPLEELSRFILSCCAEAHAQRRGYVFNELLATRAAVAPGLFLAALELVRNKQVDLHQPEIFGEIQLRGPHGA